MGIKFEERCFEYFAQQYSHANVKFDRDLAVNGIHYEIKTTSSKKIEFRKCYNQLAEGFVIFIERLTGRSCILSVEDVLKIISKNRITKYKYHGYHPNTTVSKRSIFSDDRKYFHLPKVKGFPHHFSCSCGIITRDLKRIMLHRIECSGKIEMPSCKCQIITEHWSQCSLSRDENVRKFLYEGGVVI